ncbi:MAG: beta-ketoacyl-[acyl-carrier-protein] synthase family protein [Planctomycetales bacterium]|nr:beta-ketoacyl-[acyl-carrier-protein] synthase family protein [Planctomycetales bacterium]
MQSSREVVISGVGMVSPSGIGRDAFWQNLTQGVSAVAPPQVFELGTIPIRLAAEVADFDPRKLIANRKSIKLMCREVAMGVAAAQQAVADAQLDPAQVDADRFGVIYGSEMLYGPFEDMEEVIRASATDDEVDLKKFGQNIVSKMFPLWMLKYLPNMAACHVGIAHEAYGPNNTIVQGDASAMIALIEAISVIQRGWADVMIAGGCGCRLQPSHLIYLDHSHCSQRDDDPAAASRPFDADRDGYVRGEGAAAIVLETREHAESRGATILGSVVGWGQGFEPRQDAQPYPGDAIRRTMQQAITMAGGDLRLDHVNANGLSTRVDDIVEAQAIRDVCGDTPVFAAKSYFGNLGAGSGMVELIASLLGLHCGSLPPTLNYETPDPHCPVDVIHGDAHAISGHSFLKLSTSSTGQATAVLVRQA